MSLKNKFDDVQEKGEEYFKTNKKKDELEVEIKSLKNKYKEQGVGKDVFSEKNKKLLSLEKEMQNIRKNIVESIKDINEEVEKEMQNVIG
jgi:hypothetical protein